MTPSPARNRRSGVHMIPSTPAHRGLASGRTRRRTSGIVDGATNGIPERTPRTPNGSRGIETQVVSLGRRRTRTRRKRRTRRTRKARRPKARCQRKPSSARATQARTQGSRSWTHSATSMSFVSSLRLKETNSGFGSSRRSRSGRRSRTRKGTRVRRTSKSITSRRSARRWAQVVATLRRQASAGGSFPASSAASTWPRRPTMP
mmetsp:Transcript_40059/g.92661  ORF Transcript_40059/g.92661 Transcript_40059/m.92661 type:complete len:204 (-) Transcript_40059:1042-1653(-)